jgi:regulator of protease activity HflC (stomatin/prohibitin superfamily)
MTTLIATLICLLLCIASAIVAVQMRSKDHLLHRYAETPRLLALVFFAAALALLGSKTFHVVEPGTRGVMVTFGRVEPDELGEGLHWVRPWTEIKTYDVRIRKSDEKQIAETSDTQSVTIQTILNWRVKAENVVDVYVEIGPDEAKGGLEDKIIAPAVYEVVKAEVARHKVTDLIALRHEIKEAVQTKLQHWLGKYHIVLTEVAIADIDFSEQYDRAIEAKQVEEQRAMQAEYELTRKKTEAEMLTAEAHGRADSIVEQSRGAAESVRLAAQAEADALRIRGEAQATFNRQVSETLAPPLLQKLWMDRWDGKFPHLLMAGTASPSVMLNPFDLPETPATPAKSGTPTS